MIPLRELERQLEDRSPARKSSTSSASEAAPGVWLDGLRFLAEDNHTGTPAVIERVLTRDGAGVRTAPGSAAALEIPRDWRPDCTVADTGIPGKDGYSFIREVRALPLPLRKLHVFAFTAVARGSVRERVIEAGFKDHLAKAVNPGGLLQKVASVTARV